MVDPRTKQTTKRLPIVGKSDIQAGETKFSEALFKILDDSKWNTRTNGQWAKLHKQFFASFLADQDKGRPGSPEVQARRMTIHHLLDEENPTPERLRKQVADTYDNHTAYDVAKIKLMRYHPKFQLRLWAAVFHENHIFLQLEKMGGTLKSTVSAPDSLDLDILPEEYYRRFQGMLVQTRLVDRDLYLPQMLPEQLNVNQRSPLDLKPIWACRQLGMEPSIRSFPELSSVITDIRAVEYLVHGKHAPPALLLHFSNPLCDVVSGRNCEMLAVALLKEPLPTIADKGEDETAYVNFNEQDVRSLVLEVTSAPTEKVVVLRQLFELAASDKLLPRVGYSYYGHEGIRRYASLVGRTEQEQSAVFQTVRAYLDLELAQLKDGLYLGRKPMTNVYRNELRRKFLHWQKMTPVLTAFAISGTFTDRQMWQRIQMLAARTGLLEIAQDENLGPSARIFVSFVSDDEGNRLVVHANDAKRLAQRMNNAASRLLSACSQINRLKDSMKNSEDREVFLYLLNLCVFMSLPVNPKKPFVRTLAREIEAALCEQYSKNKQKRIKDFLCQVRMELQIAMPDIHWNHRETWVSGIQDLYNWFRFVRHYQQGNHDEALELSDRFSSQLHKILDRLLEPIIEARTQKKRNAAKTLLLEIQEAAETARDLPAREALLHRVQEAKQSLDDFPELGEQINAIENRILPPRMKAAREILEDPNIAQDLTDSRNQMLRSFLSAVSQGRHFAKEEKVRRHVEAEVKREPHLGGLHARVLVQLFAKMDVKR